MSLKESNIDSASQDHSPLDPEKQTSDAPATKQAVDDESEYLTGVTLGLVVLGLCLAVLLVGLDNSILATAIPTITTAFNSLDDVGWYGSAFLVCVCALQPISGKFFQYFSLKWTYLAFLAIFEIGSLVCATAVNSVMLIVGRAIAGAGAAGLFSGALVILAHSVPVRQRPIYTGCVASMFSISSVVGPILGGVFTERVTWRWCFYINLPLGAITAVILLFFFSPKERTITKQSLASKIKHLDLPGLAMFIPAVVMVLLAVQWGGNTHAWNSATVIGLFVGFGVMICLFVAWQWHQQEEASIPPRIMMQRSVYSAAVVVFMGLGSVTIIAYYLPIWFQVIKDDTPLQSGIRFLFSVLGSLLGSIIPAGLVTAYGHFNPWLYFGSILVAVAGEIFTTFDLQTGNSMINGIQVLGGFGSSSVIQLVANIPFSSPYILVRTTTKRIEQPLIGLMSLIPQADLPTATSIAVFFQFFGGAIFLGIGNNILVSRLVSSLHKYVPDLDAQVVIRAGAAGFREVVGEKDLQDGLRAYSEALTTLFYLCAAGAVVAFFSPLGMGWKSVVGKKVVGGGEDEKTET
ncbi:related to transporter (major facilitator superfamily) [Rhynchosporium secalis]|uniref:Related to transporter (Major facilitator superfamily) n=1 Tax=Rhynchosporium secalis TaxID=38038 RepID=A0A1E1MMF9_RHYSE|nr:related to transporter (major facilitator superfamily) [Rhynchosporium secalis]